MYLQKVWLVAISMDLEGNYLLRLLIEGISHAIFLHIARIPSCNLMSNCNKREETFISGISSGLKKKKNCMDLQISFLKIYFGWYSYFVYIGQLGTFWADSVLRLSKSNFPGYISNKLRWNSKIVNILGKFKCNIFFINWKTENLLNILNIATNWIENKNTIRHTYYNTYLH